MSKTKPWKVGDWAVFDLRIVQIKKLRPYAEVSDASFSTSGNLEDRLRPLTLRNKATIENLNWYYKELDTIRGAGGFNYPDIFQYFCSLAREAMDGKENNKEPFDRARDFLDRARNYEPVIDGIGLFREARRA